MKDPFQTSFQGLSRALVARDLPKVQALLQKMDWEKLHALDITPPAPGPGSLDPNHYSLLAALSQRAQEQSGPAKEAWKLFCQRALDALVGSGYRVLDDSFLYDAMSEDRRLFRQVAKACAKHATRALDRSTCLHVAMRTLPTLAVVKAAWVEGEDINALDYSDRSCLHLLFEAEDMICAYSEFHKKPFGSVAKWLIEKGANPHLPDRKGATGLEKMHAFIKSPPQGQLPMPKKQLELMCETIVQVQSAELEGATTATTGARPRRSL